MAGGGGGGGGGGGAKDACPCLCCGSEDIYIQSSISATDCGYHAAQSVLTRFLKFIISWQRFNLCARNWGINSNYIHHGSWGVRPCVVYNGYHKWPWLHYSYFILHVQRQGLKTNLLLTAYRLFVAFGVYLRKKRWLLGLASAPDF